MLQRAQEALDSVRRRDPGVDAEVYLYEGEDRGVELKDGRVETIQTARERGMGLRLFSGGRMGFAYAGGLGPEELAGLWERADAQLRHLPPDEHRVLPGPSPAGSEAESLQATLYDPGLFREPLQGMVPRLLEAHVRALRGDKRVKKVLQIGYGEGRAEVAVANSLGVAAAERGTSCSVGLSAVAGSGSEIQVGSAARMARGAGGLDLDAVADEAALRAVQLLDARKLPTGRRAVVFDPWAAGELLDLLAGALSADAVQRGKSLFKDRLGRRVASAAVSLVDDPRRPGGPASALCDDEGVPTRRKALVEGGVLREFFFDSYTAHKAGRQSNGSAGRSGYRGLPGPDSSNFYLAPGAMTRRDLLAGTADGILAYELIGMHTADAVSGEFSVGVSGLAVSGGAVTHAIKGAMVSANVLDLLERVDAVADDLTFYGSLAAPTFRVDGLTVA